MDADEKQRPEVQATINVWAEENPKETITTFPLGTQLPCS
jgi:hypothetical protein